MPVDSQLKAGALNNRVIFKVKTETQDSFGQPVEVWADDFEAWAAFEPAGTREFPAAHKTHAETQARFRIRFREGILTDPDWAATHKIEYLGRDWDIQPPSQIQGRNFEIQFEAVQVP